MWQRTFAVEFWTYCSLCNPQVGTPKSTALQFSSRDVIKTRMRVSTTEWEREGCSLEMFFNWKKAILVMFSIHVSKQRVESKVTPRLFTSATEDIVKPRDGQI